MNVDQWFNSCANCKPYYSWVYEQETERVRYDQCVKNRDYNCLVVSNNNLQEKFNEHKSERCLVCRPGYGLNYDGVCEELNHHLCEQNSF